MGTSRASQWIVRAKINSEARLRFFCFPYAGGNAFTFRKWSDFLPERVEICAVQLPGRGSRIHEPPFTRISDLVPMLAQAIIGYEDIPMALFGHSMGAVVAFELARYLRRERNVNVVHLFASGRRAPQVALDEPMTHDLPEPEFLETLRTLNGTPKEVFEHPELLDLMIPVLRADFAVCQTYSYSVEPPLDCPITAFGGLKDGEVTREQLDAWRKQTTASFCLRMLPGDHFFINLAQPVLFELMSQDLARFI
ncbi:MAG: thioesterase II family protein [Blastocatellia bacterium]